MSDEGSPEQKIARLMKATSPAERTRKPQPPKAPPSNVVSINGDGNLIAGGDITMHVGPPPRPRVTVKTGDGVIDAKQKAEISVRLQRWLVARNAVRTKPMTPAAAWMAFNQAMKVNSYAELKPEQFKEALAWISYQTSILKSMKSAPTKIDGFRNEMISAIKARSKQLGDLNYYRPHIARTYGVTSLTAMTDTQLQELRAWIMQQKRGRL